MRDARRPRRILGLLLMIPAVVLLGILSVGAWRAVIGSAHATDNFVDSATRESRLAIANEILANNIHDAWVVRSATADELDSMVAGVLTEDWSVERLESILRAILRGGAYELAHRTDIPPKVTISEYLAVADAFLGEKETALTNGVLDRLAHLLRPAEMEHGRGKPSAAPR